ncbi:hypothetical protein CHH69_00570 [Terribacillus saccharophilus]|nr:hypothetical protein CHH69_00570 [Terribacillus saccharophilus]
MFLPRRDPLLTRSFWFPQLDDQTKAEGTVKKRSGKQGSPEWVFLPRRDPLLTTQFLVFGARRLTKPRKKPPIYMDGFLTIQK